MADKTMIEKTVQELEAEIKALLKAKKEENGERNAFVCAKIIGLAIERQLEPMPLGNIVKALVDEGISENEIKLANLDLSYYGYATYTSDWRLEVFSENRGQLDYDH